jgi:nitroreductase
MDYESALELVKQRRSIRRFKPDPVPDACIEKIIDLARWAPSGFNTQPWEFVVVKKPEYKNEIVRLIDEIWKKRAADPVSENELNRKNMNYSLAPVFIILYGDVRTRIGLPEGAQVEGHFQKIFTSSLASAFLYMHLAAASLGLASQWVSQIAFHSVDPAVKSLLGIPPEFQAYDMMALGYPAVRPRPRLVRPTASMIHYDYCGKDAFRTDEEVRDYARRTKTWTTATHRRQPDPDLLP